MKAQSNHLNDYPDTDLLFPGNYVKSAEIKLSAKPIPLQITSIEPRHELQRAGEKKKTYKPVMFFRGTDKGFVLNKTNAKRLAEAIGKDPRKWIGRFVVLCVEVVESFGKMVDAIRVDVEATRSANMQRQQQPTQQRQPEPEPPPPDDERELADAALEAERTATQHNTEQQ